MIVFESKSAVFCAPVSNLIRDRKFLSDQFLLTGDLIELCQGNEIEATRYRSAALLIRTTNENTTLPLLPCHMAEMTEIEPEMRCYAEEILQVTESRLILSLKAQVPSTVLQMLQLPGLGPKRLRIVWKELAIFDCVALHHAATENRFVDLRGFGPKTQEKILQGLATSRLNYNSFLFSDLRVYIAQLEYHLNAKLGNQVRFALTGECRRGLPICNKIEYVVDSDGYRATMLSLILYEAYELMTAGPDFLEGRIRGTQIPLIFHFRSTNFFLELFRSTGTAAHVEMILVKEDRNYESEHEIYAEAGLPYFEPELREGREEIKLALNSKLPILIREADVRGLLHAHSDYSDGSDTLEAMAIRCKAMGMQYLGISDHGPQHQGKRMTINDIHAQHREISRLNDRFWPFKILRGIEADIMKDGSLGMTNQELSNFDFVIASLHENSNLSTAESTMRLVEAIRNPFTTILGHATGRLLFGTKGHPVNMQIVIDECAAHNVAIELNCEPNRVDLDWTWIRMAVASGVRIAINPNAHSVDALADFQTGVVIARKGLASSALTLNALSLEEMDIWLSERMAKRVY